MLVFRTWIVALLVLFALVSPLHIFASAKREGTKAKIIRDISDMTFVHKHTDMESAPLHTVGQSGNKRPKPEVLVMPPRIDFKPTQLFVPLTQHIDVLNPSIKETVQIQSITSRSVHFQVLVFQQTALLPLSRIRVPIVFLPRKLGPKEGKIIVGTSVGNVKVRVSGTGQPNIYKVKDFSGLHIPVDTRISPPIQIFNPYDRVFHVKEVFTTENFLHLSLPHSHIPNQKPDGTKLWQIEPLRSKKIINLSFMSPTPGRFQGYVHIKTEEHNMILPIEIKVVPEALEALDAKIKFGILTRSNELVQRPLVLRNLGTRNISVSGVRHSRADAQLNIAFEKGMIVPALATRTVANLSYTGSAEGNVSGSVVVLHSPVSGRTSSKTSRLEVPYSARVIHGGLAYNQKLGLFPVDVHEPAKRMPVDSQYVFDSQNRLVEETRVMEFTNTFSVPVRVKQLYLKNATMLAIASVRSTPYLVSSGETWSPCSIAFTPDHPLSIELDELVIVTNATVLRLPLQMYSGRLTITSKNLTKSTVYRKSVPKQQVRSSGNKAVLRAVNVGKNGILDFGTLAIGESREHTFILTNPSPSQLSIYDATSTLHSVHVLVVSKSELEPDKVLKSRKEPVHLGQNESAHLLIRVSTKDSIGLFQGSIWVRTSSEEIDTAVVYRTVPGDVDLTVEPVEIKNVFPGHLVESTLFATSTFEETVRVYSVTSNDPRMVITLESEELEPRNKHVIGSMLFDPARTDPSSNYMANLVGDVDARFPFSDVAGKTLDWSQVPSVSASDLNAVSHAQNVWKRLRATNAHQVEATVRVTTNVQSKKEITLRGSLVQPTLLLNPTLNFSLVQVNNTKKLYVSVRNPATVPVVVVPSRHEEPVLFRQRVNGSVVTKRLTDSTFKWSPAMRPRGIVLQPNEARKIGPIVFTPTHMGSQKTTFYLRNNLTRLSTITVVGVGGMGEISFRSSRNVRASKHRRLARQRGYILHENRLSARHGAGSDPTRLASIPLTMNVSVLGLTETAGGSLYQSLDLMNQYNLTGLTDALASSLISTQFSVANSGNLPIKIRTFTLKQPSDPNTDRIGKAGCNTDLCQGEVHGFKIHGCKILPMVLRPSESKSFRLQYKPDYTKFYLKRDLVVETDWGDQDIALEVQLPKKLLPLVESIETPSFATTGSKGLMLVISLYMMYMLAASLWKELRQEREERRKQALLNAAADANMVDEETGHSEANGRHSPSPTHAHAQHPDGQRNAANSHSAVPAPAAKATQSAGKRGKAKRKGSHNRASPKTKAVTPAEPTLIIEAPEPKRNNKAGTQRMEKAKSFQEQSTRRASQPETSERPRGLSDPKGSKGKQPPNLTASMAEKDKTGLRKRRVAKPEPEPEAVTVPTARPDTYTKPAPLVVKVPQEPKKSVSVKQPSSKTLKSTPTTTPSRHADHKPSGRTKQSIPVPASTSVNTAPQRSLPSPSLAVDSIQSGPVKPKSRRKEESVVKDAERSNRPNSRQRPTKPPSKRKTGVAPNTSPSVNIATPTVQVPPVVPSSTQKNRKSTASPQVAKANGKPTAPSAGSDVSAWQNKQLKKKEKRQKAKQEANRQAGAGSTKSHKGSSRAVPPATSVWNAASKVDKQKEKSKSKEHAGAQKTHVGSKPQAPKIQKAHSLPLPQDLDPLKSGSKKAVEPVVTGSSGSELGANLSSSPFTSSPFHASPASGAIGTGRRHSASNGMLFTAGPQLSNELRANAQPFQPFQSRYGSAEAPGPQMAVSTPPTHARGPSLDDPFPTVINDSFFDFLNDTPSQPNKPSISQLPDNLALPSPVLEPQRSHAEAFTTNILQHLNTPSPTPPAGQMSLNAGYRTSADPVDEPLIPPPRSDPSQLGLGSRPDSLLWPNFVGSAEPLPFASTHTRSTDSPPHSLFKNLFDNDGKQE